ncbi:MAG TPA: nitrate- and nitrite sensing domain-containing protein [Trebonia sp.]|nr:nitrate- and nitrite sensing domain-containing protein [Trebonia sp.]
MVALGNWPVARRLIAVIVLATAMGVIFGGIQVASAIGQEQQFGRVIHLAQLEQQGIGLANALEVEQAQTARFLAIDDAKETGADNTPLLATQMATWYGPTSMTGVSNAAGGLTGQAATQFLRVASAVNGSYPSAVVADLGNVNDNVIGFLPALRGEAQNGGTPAPAGGELDTVTDYTYVINAIFQLNQAIAQGSGDSVLTNEVQALAALGEAKAELAQQHSILWAAFTSLQDHGNEYQGSNVPLDMQQIADALTNAQALQAGYTNSFASFAQPDIAAETETKSFTNTDNAMQTLESYVIEQQSLNISGAGVAPGTSLATLWDTKSNAAMQQFGQVEGQLAQVIVDRAQLLHKNAEQTAWETAIATVVVLLLIAGAALLVARSLVLPLRRLRAGALEIASVSLPQRVRQIAEAPEAAQTMEIAPIDVMSVDEVGQVARAFDLVHQEAVRLAGNEAGLRSNLNAMFVSLSRRSQSLIERLSRMIDTLELNEEDPDRLSNLFGMDHLITRMRRNSENLLVLAGHEGARKRSDPVLLGDIARAATSEIEQYGRVVLNIQPGIEIAGQASTDVVHLLAELIENATMYSSRETEVYVTAQELNTGGVLIEITDSGVGISESRLESLNKQLDEPPVVDVSVSRHMGLFVVSHLAARHGVAVRLRPSSPAGLVAMVWLPHTVASKSTIGYGERLRRLGAGHGNAPAEQSAPAGYPAARQAEPQLAAAATRLPAREAPEYRSGGNGSPANGTPANGGQANGGQASAGQASGGYANGGQASGGYASVEPSYGSRASGGPGYGSAADGGSAYGTGARAPMTGQGATTGQPSNWFRPRQPSPAQDRTSGGQPRVPAGGSRSDSSYQRQAPGGQESGHWGSQQGGLGQAWGFTSEAPEPVSGGTTGAGLPVRVPQANRVQGGDSARAGQGQDPRLTGATTAPLPAPPGGQRRSPDAARSRLSGFQHGTRRAEAQAPRSGEGSGR